MNITKAIEILEKWEVPESVFDVEELVKAKQLGKEALKLYMSLKACGDTRKGFRLTGETND